MNPPQSQPETAVEAALDERFLTYAATGDAAILDSIIVEMIDSCYRQARGITGSADLAEEAVQEAFLKLVRTAKAYDGSVSFSHWIGRLVCSAAIDQHRDSWRRHSMKGVAVEQDDGGDRTSTTEAVVERVRQALGELPENYRLPLMLHYISGLENDEIAKSLHLNASTVSMRLQRGREKLREKLERHGGKLPVAGALALLVASPVLGGASETLKITVAKACAGKAVAVGKTAAALKALSFAAAGTAVVLGSLALLELEKPQAAPLRTDTIDSRSITITTLNAGLIGHWRLDETSGAIAADASGQGHNGFVASGAWTRAGAINGALSLDGEDGHVDLPGDSNLDVVQEGDYTISAWFKPDDIPAQHEQGNFQSYCIVLKNCVFEVEGLFFDHQGRFVMRHLFDGDPVKISSAVSRSFGPGKFHHVAGVIDRRTGSTRLYVDGLLEAIEVAQWTPGAQAWDFGSVTWKIGVNDTYSGCYRGAARGTIDDVRLYNRVLLASEIAALARKAEVLEP
jgi:RNA polymerase sigma-70 factor (ECF subfamily)